MSLLVDDGDDEYLCSIIYFSDAIRRAVAFSWTPQHTGGSVSNMSYPFELGCTKEMIGNLRYNKYTKLRK